MATITKLPLYYRLFFLYVEPLASLAGAYFALFAKHEYLRLTHAPSLQLGVVPLGTSIILSQLGNLYLYFTMVEAFVLRSTRDMNVWRALLTSMLIADFGHLYSVSALGWEVFYDVPNYNAIDWGNVPFVYAGAATRVAFLLGVGLQKPRSTARAQAAKKHRSR